MRTIPNGVAQKLTLTKQTKANNADPSTYCYIRRRKLPITDNSFIEKQSGIVKNTTITDVSIAVCHPRVNHDNTQIYIAYVENGTAKVKSAKQKASIDDHVWAQESFEETASAVAIAFDGTMPKNVKGQVEFVTEELPWVFWANDGALYAQQLYSNKAVDMLAEANCTDVSAIRAMWSLGGGFDFGLIAFFIVNGYLYYRQYINGEWMDAELVSFPSSHTAKWVECAAFRTWDYRVGVQAKDENGDVYELFTQFMGIGKQNSEYGKASEFSVHVDVVEIMRYDYKGPDAYALSSNFSVFGGLYGGLYEIGLVNALSVKNVDHDGNWGKILNVIVDKHLVASAVLESYSKFTLTDTRGIEYTPISAELQADGVTIQLSFIDFNNARGECTLSYSDLDTVISMAGYAISDISLTFTPENLVSLGDPPEIVTAWNE